MQGQTGLMLVDDEEWGGGWVVVVAVAVRAEQPVRTVL